MSSSLQGSFYKIATDVSKGYLQLNVQQLKKLPPASIKSLRFELQKELNGVRAAAVSPEDEELMREKNLKISRVISAMRLIDIYCRQNKIFR